MEMAIDQQSRSRTRPGERFVSSEDERFTPDELASILREANTRQSSPAVASIEEALETARELGIDEKHVLAAAQDLQAKKERRQALRQESKRRLRRLIRYLGTIAFVALIVGVSAGVPTAEAVAMAMSIAAIVLAARWIRALFDERFPTED